MEISWKRLAEVYYIDPNYVLWLAHKFEARNPRDKKLAMLAKAFATVHYETVIRKHHLPAGSRLSVSREKNYPTCV